jgi:hypothetical protein
MGGENKEAEKRYYNLWVIYFLLKLFSRRKESMKRKILLTLSLLLIVASFAPEMASAQLLSDPKGDLWAPPGTDIGLFYYRHITGSDTYKYGKYTENTPTTQDVGWFRYAHYGEIFGVAYLANAIIPWGDKRTETAGVTQSSSGLGDVLGAIAFYFYHGDRFQALFNQTVTAPTGEYRHNKSVNMGANWWTYQPELAAVYYIVPKKLLLEINTAVSYATTNTDFGASSGELKRNPLCITSGHLTYDINPKMFISGSGYWNRGGQLEVNHKTSDGTDVATVGVMGTFGFWVDKLQILTQYQQDLDVRYGTKTNGIRLRFAYVF